MKLLLLIVGALVCFLVGLGCILPAMAKLRAFGYLPGGDIGLLFLGIVIALGGPTMALLICRRRRA